MSKRWGAKQWGLTALAVVIVGVALDSSRILFPTKEDREQAARGPKAPHFKEGDPAPEFSLPDRTGKERRLAELVSGDTMLFFTCGCANCLEVQNYVGLLRKKMGDKAPSFVNVTTMKPDGEESWLERTGLPQTILYEQKEGPVTKQYQGHPCPRAYRLRPNRTVAWIGPSPDGLPSIQIIGMAIGSNLGFKKVPDDLKLPSGSAAPASNEAKPGAQESTQRQHSSPHSHQPG